MENNLGHSFYFSNYTGSHVVVDIAGLDRHFYTEIIDNKIKKIFSNKNSRYLLAPPFFIYYNFILKIPCDDIYSYLNEYITISYVDLEKIYDDIVSCTLELAKNDFPKWYKAYLNGEGIKKEYLTPLDKLHKPTT